MTAVTAELASAAARAWVLLTEADMPPEAAVDWVREESGCEDVALVKFAVFGAAADAILVKISGCGLEHRPGLDAGLRISACVNNLRAGHLDTAFSFYIQSIDERSERFGSMWRAAVGAIAVCRRIETV